MPFHVEISTGFRERARAFNLDEARMRAMILDPWMRGQVIQLGEKDWEPRHCSLIILEGPELADADLSMGRGWSKAEKASENVTRRLVDAAAAQISSPLVAVLAEDPSAENEVLRILDGLRLETAPWAQLRARILGSAARPGGEPGYAAVLAVGNASPPPGWLFDAGLARGALGRRAVVVQLGDAGIPAELAGIEVMRLMPGDEASARALRDRLTK